MVSNEHKSTHNRSNIVIGRDVSLRGLNLVVTYLTTHASLGMNSILNKASISFFSRRNGGESEGGSPKYKFH